jgi:hypothetical protein
MSKIEVDAIDKQSGSTLTLGGSGTAVTLACGATQTGFGRTGTVDWQTGSIKTTDFTAVDGQGFFVDTNGGEVTATLPTGSAGSIVSIQDYRNTFDSANCTVQAAGSQKINGGTASGNVTLSTEGEGITLVYIDSTVGWRSIQDNDFASASEIASFVTATGGTVTTVCTNFKVHTFTGPGTFCVSSAGNAAGSNTVSYTVVAGGGSGGADNAGGGGAGGFRESKAATDSYTASPLNATSGPTYNLPVTATGFPITVGGGGAGVGPTSTKGNSGSPSIFSTITSAGGGGGGAYPGITPTTGNASAGGSGGGGYIGSGSPPVSNAGAAGNTPPVSPAQGQSGGTGKYEPQGNSGGGGGGATGAGGDSTASSSPGNQAGGGGTGVTTSITASPVAYAGGGGGGAGASCLGGNGSSCLTGGYGGGNPGQPAGGRTGAPPTEPSQSTASGATNKGGGGGATNSGTAGSGGSGVVIIRYKFQ